MLHFLIFLVLLQSTLAEEYIIERQVELIQGSWKDQPDTFMLPSAMCSGDISSNCTAMGGTRIKNKCGCSCNKENEFMEFYKSTFGFYDNEWKCFENTKVRTHSGCQTIMNERQDTIPLMTLPMVIPKVGHNVPGLTTNCAIIGGKYLECDGKWHQLNITLVRSRFYLSENEFLYYSTSKPPTPTINGRVIRLEVECTQPKKTQCVLFKVKGELKCPIQTTPTSPSSSISTTTTDVNSTETQEVTTTPTIFPRVTDQFDKTGERAGSHDGNSAMIAGAFAGVIGLVIIVIGIIVVVMRRRRKRYHVPTRSSFVVENESYGLGVDATLRFVVPGQPSQDENEYSYTTNLNREIQSDVTQRLHDNEDREYAVPYGTGTISQANSEIPIYDALNKPKNTKIDNSKKEIQPVPLYERFVLEEREADENEFDEPPEYQVPEEPFTESATVYAFPEGRGSNRVSPHTSLDGAIPSERDDDYTYYSVGDVIKDQ